MATHVMASDTGLRLGHGKPATGWLDHGIVRLDNWLARRRDYRRTVEELRRLSDRDLDDIGISRFDIPAIAQDHVDRSYDNAR